LLELRDLFHAITGELDSPSADLRNISNIVAMSSRFRAEGGRRLGAMTPSESQSTGYMLDTNLFNRVADGDLAIEAFQGLRLFATHVQLDELDATKNTSRVAALRKAFKLIDPKIVVTSSAAWNISKWDQAGWGAEDGVFQKILNRLGKLDAETGKMHRDPHNPVRDVLIAETAIKNGLALISGDRNLRCVVKEFGGRAVDEEVLRPGKDDVP
jgi:hypothetical protein